MTSADGNTEGKSAGSIDGDDGRRSVQTMRGRWRSIVAIATASLRADPRRTIGSVALDLSGGASGPVLAVGMGMLVDAVVRGASPQRFLVAVAVLGTAVGALLSVSVVADRVRIRLEENVAHHVEMRVLEMVTGLPGIAHHENPAHLHRIDRLLEESWLIAMAVPALILAVEVVARFGLTIAFLASIDARLALLPLAIAPTIAAGVVAERIRLRALDVRSETGRRADDLFRLMTDRLYGGELRTFGAAENLIARYARAESVIARDERDHRLRGARWLVPGQIIFCAGFTLGLLAIAARTAQGDVSPGQVVTVIGLSMQIVGQTQSVTGRLNWINWALTGARHYVWLLDYDERHRDPANATARAPDRISEGIRFEDVSFRYPGTDRLVLDRLDLDIEPGTVLAVVGDNGAGKTTLIKLLLRFYEPTSGRITVDGIPLPAFEVGEWRERTAAALQEHTRPELLLGEAIGIGDVPRIEDTAAIGVAASRSGADDVIDDVPGGVDAQLGLEWPGGTELSGGQWQRLSVGRSAMRDEPLLLVLDEPTAALDPTAEHALFEHYTGAVQGARLARGSITVVISHRLSTVRTADRIVVLEGGRIVEDGTHDELMTEKGTYASLFRMQAAAYG
jgi:ATP-binding cassette subfamily B protein